MRLVDVLSSVDLSVYPEAAIVIFLGVFLLTTLRVLRRPRTEIERAARLPLDDSPIRRDEPGATHA